MKERRTLVRSFTKNTTEIAHYSNKKRSLILELSGAFSYPSLLATLQNFFKEEISSEKVSCHISHSKSTPKTTTIRLRGLFYWDTLPVQDINIYVDEESNFIRSMQANLFTFRGSSYTSDLIGIHKLGDTSIGGIASIEETTIYVNHSNAVKAYQRKENEDVVSISLIVWYDKLEYQLTTYTVLPLEIRDNFGRYNFNVSLKDIPSWIYKHCKLKRCDSTTKQLGYHFYYRLMIPAFIDGKPIDDLKIYVDSEKLKVLQIDISLSNKDEYKKEEIFAILEKTMKQYGNLLFVNKENGGYSYLGQFLTVNDDNVITITPVNDCNYPKEKEA